MNISHILRSITGNMHDLTLRAITAQEGDYTLAGSRFNRKMRLDEALNEAQNHLREEDCRAYRVNIYITCDGSEWHIASVTREGIMFE